MSTLKFLLQKEFKQIFRNRIIIAMVTAVPVIQLAILPFAADFEIKNINVVVVDLDHSTYSRKLIATIPASGYFRLTAEEPSYAAAYRLIEDDKADLLVEIPRDFERNLVREGHQKVLIAADAINGTNAGLGTSYLVSILQTFNTRIRVRLIHAPGVVPTPAIRITFSNWFNPSLSYKMLMVPGILAMLVTLIGGFLSALNIVREKEIGTIEQINVTPIKKFDFILGKLIPFWVLGMVVFTVGLLTSWLVYGMVSAGSILLLYGFIALYLLLVLGFGLLVSTFCQSQQQAMLIMFFFMMVFILMSGLFTPADIMPGWARILAFFNPLSYLIEVMRMIMLKGSGLPDVASQLEVIALYALLVNGLAVLYYKKTT